MTKQLEREREREREHIICMIEKRYPSMPIKGKTGPNLTNHHLIENNQVKDSATKF
jgi:hypothetical protein